MSGFDKAKALIHEFKRDSYAFGPDVLPRLEPLTAGLGRRAVLVCNNRPGREAFLQGVYSVLGRAGIAAITHVDGVRPNAPREDVERVARELDELEPEVTFALGGGSTIDATKAAIVLCCLGGSLDDYFGVGKVTQKLRATGKTLTPIVAIQTASSSAAHLTKYSNITNLATGQKKLIVDEAIVPIRALFDYGVTRSMPAALTTDGAFDGIAHVLEVLYGAVGKPFYGKMTDVAGEAIRLVVQFVERALEDPDDMEARIALGLATDLGGYAIMLGGTNGGHLTSFSLVDILSHGRACAIMNPYYTVFFAPAIEGPLRMVGRIFKDAGLSSADMDKLAGRKLGVAVAEAMFALSRRVDFPTTLGEVMGFTDEHIERALAAAKDPQLKMKLENMPVSLTYATVDVFMRPVREAARDGDLSAIKSPL